MSRVKKAIYLFGVALAVASAWYLFSVNSFTTSTARLTVEQTKATYPYRFEQNIKTAYDIHFMQQIIFHKSQFIAQKSTKTYDISAILNMRVLKKEEGHIWSAIELSSFSLHGTGVDSEILNSLTPYYESMFLVKHDTSWNIQEMRFPGKIENFLGVAQMIYLLEVINLNKRAYQLEQKDSVGRYQAFYKKNLTTIHKQKKHYITSNIDGNYTIKVKKHSLIAIVDQEKNWLKTLNIDERISLIDQNNMLDIDDVNTVKLTKIKDNHIDMSLDIWLEKRSIEEILKEFDELQRTDNNVFKILSQKRTKRHFIQNGIEIDTLANDIDTNIHKIKEYIKAFPENTYKLKQIIHTASDIDSMRLISILSLVGTPESQTLLVDLANDSTSTYDDQIRSVIALGGVINPTIETVNALIEFSDIQGDESEIDRSNTALLALGVHAKHIDHHDEIVNHISSSYNSSSSLSREKSTLLAIQNAGAENFLAEIDRSLDSKSTKVRKLALGTLATIKNKELRDELLTQQLKQQEKESLKTLIKKYLKHSP